ncbi:MAG TPA: hypothetical protein VMX15_02940 [Candidatus Heimdallarchaeota archaeon]|nr:hypothetical protein [Candidatus Heimdallarchaeota archaeon]
MRGRWLKPEFFRDQKMAQIGPEGALVYQALWIVADDSGMAPCDPEILKGEMFARWTTITANTIKDALQSLAETKRITFYQGGDETFAQINSWRDNQKVHKPSAFTHKGDYSKRGKELRKEVPHWCRTSA